LELWAMFWRWPRQPPRKAERHTHCRRLTFELESKELALLKRTQVANFEAKVTSKGQITLPAKLRSRLRIEAGDNIVFSETPDGGFRIGAKRESLRDLKGIVRSGPAVTSADVKKWVEEARERSAPEGLRRSLKG
jgi:antitoxin PrlF